MAKSTSASRSAASSDSTLDELKGLLAEAEKALASAPGEASEEVTALRDRLRGALEEGKVTARRALDYAKEQASHADEAIHTHPYAAIGIAAGVGLLVGALITRRCSCNR